MANGTPPASFINRCSVEVSEDDSSLTVSCHLRDKVTGRVHEMTRTIALKPIVEFLHHQFQRDNIGGLGDWLKKAKNAAKRIASAKGVKDLWSKVGPVAKELAGSVPGGKAALVVATKINQKVQAAKKGNPKAIAALKTIANHARAGDPLAGEMMKTARALSIAQDMKEAKSSAPANSYTPPPPSYDESEPDSYDYEEDEDEERYSGFFDFEESFDDYEGEYVGAWPWSRKKRNRRARAYDAAPRAPANRRAAAPTEDGSDENGDAGMAEDDVAGWFYNRPFRSPAKAILDGSPGVSMALRSLYTNGLDTVLNLKRKTA